MRAQRITSRVSLITARWFGYVSGFVLLVSLLAFFSNAVVTLDSVIALLLGPSFGVAVSIVAHWYIARVAADLVAPLVRPGMHVAEVRALRKSWGLL